LCGIELDERFPAFTIGPREKRYRTIEALKAWCRSLVRDRPLLLIFEDLQWIDPTSKMLLNQLVDWAKAAPILIIATVRTDRLNEQAHLDASHLVPALAEGSSHTILCEVRQLTEGQTMQLIAAVAVGGSMPPKVMEAVQQKS